MSDTKSELTLEKAICIAIDNVNKVVPIHSIEHVSCFYNWLDSIHKLRTAPVEYIEADYYRGSENDLQNIFLEILALASSDHCYHGHYVLKRLEFLANEGLHIVDLTEARTKNFKVPDKEVNSVIANIAKKTKKNKPTKKKPAKRLKRDKSGRFTKNK